jgi:transcriptional regulator of heat shock response
MDGDLILIFGFIITIVTMALLTAHVIHRRVVRHDERKLELKAQIEQAKADQIGKGSADYSKLEERVRVLERIATDGNHNLAAQIEQLRDLQEIEDLTSQRERAR